MVGEAHGTGPIGLAICQLEGLGIPVFARHYHMAVVYGHCSFGLGGVQLLVPHNHAKQAVIALQAMMPLRLSSMGKSFWGMVVAAMMISIPLAPSPAALYPRSQVFWDP